MKFRFNCLHATAVVPEPMNGSNTKSFSFEYKFKKYLTKFDENVALCVDIEPSLLFVSIKLR